MNRDADPAGQAALEPPPRNREQQDALNHYLYHPLARRLARALAPTGVTPNMLSIAGGLVVVAAGWIYTLPQWPLTTLAALALHMGWHVLDGADGDLARMTGRAGPAGEIVDGLSDYASHIVLYVILGHALASAMGGAAYGWMWAAGLSRIAQTNHYEVSRRQYQFWVEGRAWLRNSPFRSNGGALGVMAEGIMRFYLWLARLLEGGGGTIDALHREAQRDPQREAAFRASAAHHLRPLIGRRAMLGSNHRTIALGLSMLAGSPLYFFVYEAVLLNLVLVGSLMAQARAARAISGACR